LLDYETNTSHTIRVRSTDSGAGNLWVEKDLIITINPVAAVVGRRVFYNNSAFDTPPLGTNDDNAVAADKQALRPGQKAAFANYTSYSRGVNGIIVDIAHAADPDALGRSDFLFRVGNNDHPENWSSAPEPISVLPYAGIGPGGSDRVIIIWTDGAIANKWLQVTVRATPNTGLTGDDVFYFGNAVGDTGNNAAGAAVDSQDEVAVRGHKTGFTPATISNVYDFNRDRRVNATDELIARSNHTTPATELHLIDLSGSGQPLRLASSQAALSTPTAGVPVPPPPHYSAAPGGAGGLTTSAVVYAVAQTSAGTFAPATEAAAHDAALAPLGAKPGSTDPRSLQWAFLYEFEQLAVKRPPVKKNASVKEAVDLALAAYGQ